MILSSNIKKLIVVMGGGLTDELTVPKHVQDRCEFALNNFDVEQCLIIGSSSYSMNVKPKFDATSNIKSEASAIYEYIAPKLKLATAGVEQFSHDTIGSVFFCLDMFASKLNILDVKFITSDFHANRVDVVANFINERVFRGVFNIEVMSVAATYAYDSSDYVLRKAKESLAIKRFVEEYADINSHREFLIKLLFCHSNYNHFFCSDSLLKNGMLY